LCSFAAASAEPAAARDLEDDVRALVDLVQRRLVALRVRRSVAAGFARRENQQHAYRLAADRLERHLTN